MSRWDVVIIGSGISSLTCAALLSKRGKSVCVLEQHSKSGGYMHNFSRFGETFDTGAHYVGAMGEGQPFRTLLKYLGVFDEKDFVALDPEGFDVMRFPGFEARFSQGYERNIQELSAAFPGEREAVRGFFARVQAAVRFFPTYEFNEAMDQAIPVELLESSLADVVRGLTSNPRLQCVFYSYCVLHGVKPEDVPFGLHSIVVDSLIRGPYGLNRGGDALTRKFVAVVEKNGGKVLTRQRVTALEVSNRQVSAVVTEAGERFEAEWVISGIHPKAVLKLISEPQAFSPAFRDRVNGMQESVGMFGIYASCSAEIPFHPLRNYYYFDSEDPARLLNAPADSQAGQGNGAVFAARGERHLPAGARSSPVSFQMASPKEFFEPWRGSRWNDRPEEYERRKTQLAERAFERLGTFHPGLRSCVKKYVTSTPLSNLHFNGSESSYGIYHSIQNTGPRAMGPRTRLLNLLLTGQNCLFPGLLGASVAALRTSGHILGIKPMLTELRMLAQTESAI